MPKITVEKSVSISLDGENFQAYYPGQEYEVSEEEEAAIKKASKTPGVLGGLKPKKTKAKGDAPLNKSK